MRLGLRGAVRAGDVLVDKPESKLPTSCSCLTANVPLEDELLEGRIGSSYCSSPSAWGQKPLSTLLRNECKA